MSWRDEAACKGLSPAIFHPGKGETGTKARAICRSCPSIDDCLQDALDDPQQLGIAGNTSLVERRLILRKRGIVRGQANGSELKPINHGTQGGHLAHQRRGEQSCEPCHDANLAARAIYRAAKRAALRAA